MAPAFRVFRLAELPAAELPRGRGVRKPIVDAGCGATALDVHLNVLDAREPGGRYHRHTNSDNVYIVRRGVGRLVVEGRIREIREDDVVYIPAGTRHSLANDGEEPLELFEIYAPAGDAFDFVTDDPGEGE